MLDLIIILDTIFSFSCHTVKILAEMDYSQLECTIFQPFPSSDALQYQWSLVRFESATASCNLDLEIRISDLCRRYSVLVASLASSMMKAIQFHYYLVPNLGCLDHLFVIVSRENIPIFKQSHSDISFSVKPNKIQNSTLLDIVYKRDQLSFCHAKSAWRFIYVTKVSIQAHRIDLHKSDRDY